MSWASRRKFFYLSGVILFFAIVIGIPAFLYLYDPASCFDNIQNQGETAVDRSGPCQLLDERQLIPHTVQWARGFSVRAAECSAVAYIENPNDGAGVHAVPYRFKLYDDRNILVADREGVAYIMPGTITPVYTGAIETGNRIVARTFFEFTAPLVWERLADSSRLIEITGRKIENATTEPRVSALAENTDVKEIRDVEFVAVVFDTVGNAIASSRTTVTIMEPGERYDLVFTWPDPMEKPVGRIDVLPMRKPVPLSEAR